MSPAKPVDELEEALGQLERQIVINNLRSTYGRTLFLVGDDGNVVYPPERRDPDLAPVLPFKCRTGPRKPARRPVRASGGGAA